MLYIIRHAWAGHFGDPDYPDDRKRPLTEEGRERFCRVVDTLAERGFQPRVIATSPLVRCRQTADLIDQIVRGNPRVVELDALRPGSDLDEMMRWTNRQDFGDVAWVGHAPDVGQMAADLIGHGASRLRFAKGAVAAIQFTGKIARGDGELRWLLTAKMLGC